MFNFRAKPDGHLDREIRRALFEMNKHEPHSNEYGVVLDRYQKLIKLRADTKRQSVSPDTVLTTAAYLVGTLMIIHHEHLGVITTKATNHLVKPK